MEPQLKRLLGSLKATPMGFFDSAFSLEGLTDLQAVVEAIQNELSSIMKCLLQEKKQYQRNMALSMQEMQEKYESKLVEKDRLVGELGHTIDSLIANSKQMELDLSKKLSDSEQEIQMYKNMLRKKYLKEIEVERQLKKDSARKPPESPLKVKKVLSFVSKHSYRSPQSAASHTKLSETRQIETRASTLANRTSQLLSALKLRTNLGKQSAVVHSHRKPQHDSSIITINSTILPGRIEHSCEPQLLV